MGGVQTQAYSYNGQGSLVATEKANQNYQISVDAHEKVTSYKGDNCQYDQDGYLIAKGDVKYQFNSQGTCVCARA